MTNINSCRFSILFHLHIIDDALDNFDDSSDYPC